VQVKSFPSFEGVGQKSNYGTKKRVKRVIMGHKKRGKRAIMGLVGKVLSKLRGRRSKE
jgi:hypothetical protein